MAVNRLDEILEEKGGEVLKVDVEATVFEAVQLMVEKNVGSLLVTEEGDITGSSQSATTSAASPSRRAPTGRRAVREIMSARR